MNRFKAGFTLIELLVVIAIIGILAAIIFVALGSARVQGSDARVKADLNQLSTAMEYYSDTGAGDYGAVFITNTCPTSGDPSIFDSNSQVSSIIAALNSVNGNKTKCAAGTLSATGNATSWAIASPVQSSTQYWCVDSSGQAKLSDERSWWQILLAYVIPPAYAVAPPVGPNLGGGNGLLAACP